MSKHNHNHKLGIERHAGGHFLNCCDCGEKVLHGHSWSLIARVPRGYARKIHALLPRADDGIEAVILSAEESVVMGHRWEDIHLCYECSTMTLAEIKRVFISASAALQIFHRAYWFIGAELGEEEEIADAQL